MDDVDWATNLPLIEYNDRGGFDVPATDALRWIPEGAVRWTAKHDDIDTVAMWCYLRDATGVGYEWVVTLSEPHADQHHARRVASSLGLPPPPAGMRLESFDDGTWEPSERGAYRTIRLWCLYVPENTGPRHRPSDPSPSEVVTYEQVA